jgi:O-glycosyl hydrolase
MHLFQQIPLVLIAVTICPLNGGAQEKEVIDVRIDIRKTYQTIENFGASDAWSCQFVGQWPDHARNAIADWLFSMDTLANGNPKGIGLSLWRFNIGAGSAQQGDSSGIKDEWRRAESFVEKDKQYNWNRQQGQLWFVKAAKQRSVQQFLLFYNSPPALFTTNGRAYASKGQCNISSSRFDAFADYTVDVLKAIKRLTGMMPDYISPVNEPQWDWSDGGQEGCPYTNKEISGVVKAFNAALMKNRLPTKIIIPESGNHTYVVEEGDKPGRGNQVMAFFHPSSPSYIGNLTQVAKTVASHSYFTSSPFSYAISLRKRIADSIAAVKGLNFWQSEYCILGDNKGEINGSRRDLGMKAALYIAKCMYADLAGANATAWQWWLAISPYQYKDGLIYIDKNKTGGNYYDSKMLWAFGNYSRFIRPGMKRVDVQAPATEQVLVSAYKDENKKKLVVVVVNGSAEEQALTVNDINGTLISSNNRWVTHTTSELANLQKQVLLSNRVHILPHSVVTIETMYK